MTNLKIFFLVLFIFSLRPGLAQADSLSKKTRPLGRLVFSAGISEPISTNVPTGSYNDPLVYSTGGMAYHLALYTSFAKYFDACLSFHYEDFNFDNGLLEEILNSQLQEQYVAYGVDAGSKRKVVGLQLGVSSVIPIFLKGRICFEPNIQFGLSRLKTQEITYGHANKSYPATPVYTATYSASKSENLIPTASAGAGIRYSLKSHLCFTLQFDYIKFLTEPKYNMTITNSMGDVVVAPVTESAGWGYYTVRFGIGWLIYH